MGLPYNNIAFFIKRLQYFNHHILHLIETGNRERKYYVFHLESIYAKEYTLPAHSSDNVFFIDINRLPNIKAFLVNNNIALFVFPDPKNIIDFLLLQICHDIGIKTIYSQHGFRINFNVFSANRLFPKKRIFMVDKMIIKKYFMYYRIVLTNAIYLSHRPKFVADFIAKTFKLLINPAEELSETLYLCDKAYVYGTYDKDILMKYYGYKEENIIVHGYPIFLKVNRFVQNTETDFVLYISSGLRETGVLNISFEEEIEFYRTLSFQVARTNNSLVVKLHPTENLEHYVAHFKNDNRIKFYYDENLEILTNKAKIVIGDYSTALFYPILLYKPIIILTLDYMNEFPFDYSKYGIGVKTSLSNLSSVINLQSTYQIDKSKYDKFIEYFIGYHDENGQTKSFYETMN